MASLPKIQTIEERIAACVSWPQRFPPEQWSVYKSVIAEARRRGVPFAVGGGLAAITYGGQWRNTKDLDIYLLHRDRDRMVGILAELGLRDYYEKQEYDRKWIYRSYKDEVIVDIMWAMANQRTQVDESWLEGPDVPEVNVDGERFRLLAPEEALWSKLYVLQRDRCDWPDGLNLIYGVGPEMDWRRVLRRVENDSPLLAGLLTVFAWLCPERARQLPAWLWQDLRLQAPKESEDPQAMRTRAALLDSRDWFTPVSHDEEVHEC